MISLKDISTKTPADLSKMVEDKREALRLFRFGSAGAKSKNVKEGRAIRKDIAVLLTVLKNLDKSTNFK